MKGKKIFVFSIALEGYSNLFKDCIISQKKYCEKFDYTYILVDKSPRKLLPKEAAWLKIFLLRCSLNGDYEWVAFIDADCEIREHAPSFIEDLGKGRGNKSIFLAHGFSGRINSGVIFLKNTIEARDYLEMVIKNKDYAVPKEDEALYENGHMIHYGKNHPDVAIIDWVKWNNNQTLNSSSYIQHYSGGILREEYLKKRPLLKFRYKILKRLRNKFINKASDPETSMIEIKSLLSYYSKNNKVFNCENFEKL